MGKEYSLHPLLEFTMNQLNLANLTPKEYLRHNEHRLDPLTVIVINNLLKEVDFLNNQIYKLETHMMIKQHLVNVFAEITIDLNRNNAMFALSHGNATDMNRQLGVLDSECNELERALTSKDPIEFFDGIGDVTYVLGSLYLMNFDQFPECYEVYRALDLLTLATSQLEHLQIPQLLKDCTVIAMVNNLTKYDVSIEDATKTQNKYEAMGIPTNIVQLEPEMFIVKSSITNEQLDVVEGKVLKSVVRHQKPDFSKVVYPLAHLIIPDPIV